MTGRGRELPPSFFALFDLEPRFALPIEQLDAAYRTLARRVHPDRFVNGTEAEQRQAIETATHVNEDTARSERRCCERATCWICGASRSGGRAGRHPRHS